MSTTTNPSYVQPAIIGGCVVGVLSALPIVYLGNLCCCMWVISGGLVAAFVLQQNHPPPITPGDGALAGLLAGIVGAFVHLILSIPIDIVMAPMERAILQRLVDMSSNMAPEMREMIDRFSRQGVDGIGFIIVHRIIAFMAMLFIGAVFSTIGGLLGAVIFRRQAPPSTIDVPSS